AIFYWRPFPAGSRAMAPREIIPKALKGVILENRPLAPLTTWKIGGPAKYLAAAAGLEEVFALMGLAQARGRGVFAPPGPDRRGPGFLRLRIPGGHSRQRGRRGAPQRRGGWPGPGRGAEPGLGGHPQAPAPGISGRGTGAGLSFLPAPLFPPLAGGGGGVSPEHPGPAGGGAAAPGGIADGPPGPAARQLP